MSGGALPPGMPAAGHHAFPVGRRAGVEGNTSHISTISTAFRSGSGRGRSARSRKIGLRSHRHHQHHDPGAPD
jgi:hypothetical protein